MSKYKIGDKVKVTTMKYEGAQWGLEGRVVRIYSDHALFDIAVAGLRAGHRFEYCYGDEDVRKLPETPFERDLHDYIQKELERNV